MQGDLIEVYEIGKGFDTINTDNYFTADRSNITNKRK